MNKIQKTIILLITIFSACNCEIFQEQDDLVRQMGKVDTVDLTSENPVDIELNFVSQNKLYKIKKNVTVNLKLSGNKTTGYEWRVEDKSVKNNNFKFLNLNDSNSAKDYKTDSHREGMVGVGGTYTFKVNLNSLGLHHLDFIYKRSWENDYISFMSANFEVSE